ncbi:MAG: hypothetical protein HY917_04500 [Candidatus Diapherotrites archaeon]|nr:hypothetical protein [Candidatus Diapherotrites archaeon]
MPEITEEKKRKGIQLIERMLGKSQQAATQYARIQQATPAPISEKKVRAILEEIRLPTLSQIRSKTV